MERGGEREGSHALPWEFVGMVVRNRVFGTIGNDVLTGLLDTENVIYANAGDDRVTGGNLKDTLVGEAGRDLLFGLGGNDSLWGGGGDDRLYGGAGSDYLAGDGGNDALDGGLGDDRLYGGLGNDTYYIDSAGDTVVELAGQGLDTVFAFVSWDMPYNVENLIMRGTAITANGNAIDNVVVGSALANSVTGGGGNDRIAGADGDDVISGDTGIDALNGGAGRDHISGGTGNDGVWGGGGNDTIFGEDGNDRLIGDGGNDVISGGRGIDVMTGGEINKIGPKGLDTYVWQRGDIAATPGAFDRITDFTAGDRLDISAVFDIPPSSIADVVRASDTAAGTLVSLDLGGGAYVDLVRLDGVHKTVASLIAEGAIVV